MKPLVGQNLRQLKTYLRLADMFLEKAEKLSLGAYGSSMLTQGIRIARRETEFGYASNNHRPFCALLERNLTPPITPKVERMMMDFED